MKLHLIGGFLGSGKTTAIISAAKQLIRSGQRVGVITNDQGKYLVDTAFFQLADIPTVEVTGGCFCCNYDDLDARLEQLQDAIKPDVIFAESVGSCADIVSTVVKPLLKLRPNDIAPSSFSVFTDGRLLRQWLLGRPMPFADNVVYIFEKQIEEGSLLVINKTDLLTPAEVEETVNLARQKFPQKMIRLQNSLDGESVDAWVDLLNSDTLALPEQSLEIDYARYGDGEAQLAWLDEEVTLTSQNGKSREAVIDFLDAIINNLRQAQIPVGHLKFIVGDESTQAKISFTTLSQENWQVDVPQFSNGQVKILINARVQMEASALYQLVKQSVEQSSKDAGRIYYQTNVDVFHPGYPQPTHRL